MERTAESDAHDMISGHPKWIEFAVNFTNNRDGSKFDSSCQSSERWSSFTCIVTWCQQSWSTKSMTIRCDHFDHWTLYTLEAVQRSGVSHDLAWQRAGARVAGACVAACRCSSCTMLLPLIRPQKPVLFVFTFGCLLMFWSQLPSQWSAMIVCWTFAGPTCDQIMTNMRTRISAGSMVVCTSFFIVVTALRKRYMLGWTVKATIGKIVVPSA